MKIAISKMMANSPLGEFLKQTIQNMKKNKEYTALVRMGEDAKGGVALHSTRQTTIENAIKWARLRFNRDFVVVLDSDYPRLYEHTRFTGKDDPNYISWSNWVDSLYDDLLKKLK